MTELVQVALAESVAEAEEIQEILREVGIDAKLEPAVEHHPRETDAVWLSRVKLGASKPAAGSSRSRPACVGKRARSISSIDGK